MQKSIQIIFYILLALYFFGVGFPLLNVLLGIGCILLVYFSL
jgi:hypothetical protein